MKKPKLSGVKIGIVAALGSLLALSTSQDREAQASTSKTTTTRSEEVRPRIEAFGEELARLATFDFQDLQSIEQLVDQADVVAVGRLIGIQQGRRAIKGAGCLDPAGEDGEATCPADPRLWSYTAYANLVIKVENLLKGTLSNPYAPLYAEYPSSNNATLTELQSSAPMGARLIILGSSVSDAELAAKKLEANGLVQPGLVKRNLIAFSPISIGFETVDNWIAVPGAGAETVDKFLAPTGATSFNELISVISKYARAGASR